jgi:uncharacterized membrane protein
MKDEANEAPLGTAVGTVVGSLIGLLGGPVGLAAGAAAGAFLGYATDAFNYGVGMEFVDEVSRNLTPGKSALVAEVDEFWTLGLDLRMEALGGTVVRQWRLDVERDLIENEIQARNAELSQLKAEHAQAEDEHKARLEVKIRTAEGKLKAALKREKAKVEALKQQAETKVETLQKQVARASPETKIRIERLVAEIQAESEKLAKQLELKA